MRDREAYNRKRRERENVLRSSLGADHRRPWTPKEDAMLAAMWEAGDPTETVCRILRRTEQSIYYRTHKLREAGKILTNRGKRAPLK